MSDSLFGPPRDPAADTLDKRLWIGTRIAQLEKCCDTLQSNIDALASRIGPAPAIPEAGPSKEDQLEKLKEEVLAKMQSA